MFRDIQIVIITNFVVVSSVGIKRADCTMELVEMQFENLYHMSPLQKKKVFLFKIVIKGGSCTLALRW